MLVTPNPQALCQASLTGRASSYSPYSRFAVGAALLCGDGSTVLGCNVENASYGLAICAERTAVVKVALAHCNDNYYDNEDVNDEDVNDDDDDGDDNEDDDDDDEDDDDYDDDDAECRAGLSLSCLDP